MGGPNDDQVRRYNIIKEWLLANPTGTKTECSEETGIPETSVRRYIKLIEQGEEPETADAPSDGDRKKTAQMRRELERKELRKLRNKKTFFEIVAEDIISAITALPPPPKPKRQHLKLNTRQAPEEIATMISDCQIGQLVDVGESGGLGGYSTDIFLERLEFFKASQKKIFEIHTSNTPCPAHNLFFLGDIVDGTTIFKGQQRQTDIHTVKQVIVAVKSLAEYISWLAGLYPWQINVYGVIGNHGRVGDRGVESPLNNFDYLIYWMLDKWLEGHDNVSVYPSESWYQIVERMGWAFLLVHGDDTRSWAGIPFYGLLRSAANYRRMFVDANQGYNYLLCGHHHREAEIEDHIIMNSNWVGGSELSMKRMQAAGAPTQTMFGIHPDFGITWKRNIKLIPPQKRRAKRIKVYRD